MGRGWGQVLPEERLLPAVGARRRSGNFPGLGSVGRMSLKGGIRCRGRWVRPCRPPSRPRGYSPARTRRDPRASLPAPTASWRREHLKGAGVEDARAGGPGANARSRLSRLVNPLRAVSS